MNPRHLKIFLEVCNCQNMTVAGKNLHISQPSVSQVITELERDLEVRLFDRMNHRLFLTNAGERLRDYANHIVHLSDQARLELKNLELLGPVRIAASLTIGTYLLPKWTVQVRNQYPNIELLTWVENTSLIEKMLLEDKIDLGFVEGPTYSPFLVEEKMSDDFLVIIASPHHSLARQSRIIIHDLQNQVFISREPGSGSQDIFNHVMQSAGVEWKTAGIVNNNEALKKAVTANMGLGMVSEIAIKDEVAHQHLVALDIEGLDLHRRFNLVYHRQKYMTPAIQLIKTLSSQLCIPMNE